MCSEAQGAWPGRNPSLASQGLVVSLLLLPEQGKPAFLFSELGLILLLLSTSESCSEPTSQLMTT